MNNKDDSKKEENNIVFVKIGQRIQKYRIQRNLTQDQVAETTVYLKNIYQELNKDITIHVLTW